MSRSYIAHWTLAQAKREFAAGVIRKFDIEAVPLADGEWSVFFYGALNAHGPLIDVRSGETRIFKTLDAAVKIVREIGFRVDVLTSQKN